MILNIFLVILGVFFFIYVVSNVRKKLFSEKESILWILGSAIVVFLSIFPEILTCVSSWLGILYPPTLLFLLAIFILVILLIRKEKQINLMNERIKELAQFYSLLEKRIREINSNKEKL